MFICFEGLCFQRRPLGRPVVTKPFETHTRISVQLPESNLEEDVINVAKEYVHPKIKTGFLSIHLKLCMQ